MAPVGERPIALGHHRFEWPHAIGFVEPATGVGHRQRRLQGVVRSHFRQFCQIGWRRRPNTGWHGPENLGVPEGIRLVFQPAHSPELQPAEDLWQFVDEPLANRCVATIESLDHAIARCCIALPHQCDTIRDNTLFHEYAPARRRYDLCRIESCNPRQARAYETPTVGIDAWLRDTEREILP